MSLQIAISQLAHAKGLALPSYASEGAAGLDLVAALDHPITLAPMARVAIPTGIAVAIPQGFEGQIRARSGRARREGLAMVNAPGTIDSDYRGEIQVLAINLGNESIVITRGDRIAQLVVCPVIRVTWSATDDLDATPRGGSGFGSTGR
ncbi:MAG: dUTP diphosphatase [Deltaproteobacteria bacterium]|nr:dUTP diphosphatase [Deltaproteobacteria bacterium]